MHKNWVNILLTFTIAMLLSSCMNDNALRDFEKLNKNETESGVFIINEGNFMYSNASLSYYNPKTKEVINDVFYKSNALPLGDVAQSMTIKDSLGYIVLNNSGKIYIININTFKYVGKITGLISPRSIHFINNQKAYISDLYSKIITIYDPSINEIIGQINTNNGNTEFSQHNSELFVQKGNMVYVNSWSYDNKILVINTDKDEIIDSITVGKQPNSMVIDKNNMLWVLSDGGFAGSTYGQENASITKINTQNNTIANSLVFSDNNVSPRNLCINSSKDTIYYLYNSWAGTTANKGVYCINVLDNTLPTQAFIPMQTQNIYGLNVDANNNNEIYVSDAIDYSQNGAVYRYNSTGTSLDTFKVSITPNGFCFK